MCMPLFDGGNLGFRRRQMEKLFQRDDYVPFANFYEDLAQDAAKIKPADLANGQNGTQNGA